MLFRRHWRKILFVCCFFMAIVLTFWDAFSSMSALSSPIRPAHPTPAVKTIVPTVRATAPAPSLPCASVNTYEAGIVWPQWSPGGYGPADTRWLTGLAQMKQETAACWIEMPVLFFQRTQTSTEIYAGASTPSVASVTYGVQWAHRLGLHVFLVPLVDVQTGADTWVGSVHFPSVAQEQTWFANYWQILRPYAVAAQANQVEQFSVGTEIQWLQQHAPATLWNTLLSNARTVFHQQLTYDMNWNSLGTALPSWMGQPALSALGVSAYVPLINASYHVAPAAIPALWKTKIQAQVDALSQHFDKPVVLSETGYRDSTDALYQPWSAQTQTPKDPQEQAAAYGAVLQSVTDPHIQGSFFYGWSDVGLFDLDYPGCQAIQTIHQAYQLL